ncbi:MAG: GDSL-type esterase/lipase family protein [Pirellula sp.]
MTTIANAQTKKSIEYPYITNEPQKNGWPLTPEERAYVVDKPEHDRRPGRESNKHLPDLWPQIPTAGYFGSDAWLKLHEAHVKTVQANQGPIDVLLVGDSITIQWGTSWHKHFPNLRAINIGIGGDKTQNVLWRLDHGGVEGLDPKAIVLMIGNNNMFFTPETGIQAAALGIQMCVKNLREKFPASAIVVAKILPAHSPGTRFYEDIKRTNIALDSLKLDIDPNLRVLELWSDFTIADGTIKKDLFTEDNIHLSPAGYAVYAGKLSPLLEAFFRGKPMPLTPAMPSKANVTLATEKPSKAYATILAPKAASGIVLPSKPVLSYAYVPYNEGKLDPQISGWPLSAEELAWVGKGEYTRKPGHDAQKHLPEMWPITPTAPHWSEGEANPWIEHHAQCIEKVQAMKDDIDIMLIGDSITQGWGGGWDGAPLNAAWQKHFGDKKTVNLGIGGDRTEGVLWRLDHGAVHGTSPKTIVLMIGVNNANGVQSNGVPVSAAAEGISLCVANLRLRCPHSQIVLVKILPAFEPAKDVGAKVRQMNEELDRLKLDSEPNVHVLNLWEDFTNTDGTINSAMYSDGHLHLSPSGYDVFAGKLKPVVDSLIK